MKWNGLLAVMALPSLAACSNVVSPAGNGVDPQSAPSITLESVGGIASLRVQLRLDSTAATLTRETCPMQVSPANCGTSGRREVISVERSEVARLFALTASAEFRALKTDYGHSTQGADLMDHTLTVNSAGRKQSVRGDDITRPDLMAALMVQLNTLR